MRFKLPLLALSLGLLLTAEKCADKGAADMASLFDTKWVLQSLAGKAIQVPEGANAPWIQLAADKTLSGFGGCNKLMGKFDLDDSTIGFPGVASTKMFCQNTQELEDGFLGALRNANSFRLDKGLLKLMQGETELAALSSTK